MIDRRRFLASLGAVIAAPALAASRRSPTRLIAAARAQVGVTRSYDSAYSRLAFPGGDVVRAKGVCTDVIVRAYRGAFGLDLQALVNTDMHRAFSAYPRRWGLHETDSNIDHRRVPNLQTFFVRAGARLAMPSGSVDWQPGDIFTSLVGGTLPHIGFASDRRAPSGHPLVIHNIGAGTREEDALFAWPLTGRYRWALG